MSIYFRTARPVESFIDYLTTYNASESTVNASNVFNGFSCSSVGTTPIPSDTGAGLPPEALNPGGTQVFTTCNVTIRSASTYTSLQPSGNRVVRGVRITFTVQGTGNQDVGIAFAGHLAEPSFWGLGNGAGNFPGASPQVLVDESSACTLTGGTGNNHGDWSCTYPSSKKGFNININPNAIVSLPSITGIVKDTVPDDVQNFHFTNTQNPNTNFAAFDLDDDAGAAGGDATLSNTKQFIGIDPGATRSKRIRLPDGNYPT